jgi:hypothetical protein
MISDSGAGLPARNLASFARFDVKDPSSHGAALLLMKVSKIALSELCTSPTPLARRPCLLDPTIYKSNLPASSSREASPESNIYETPRPRFRTISMESMDHLGIIPPSPLTEEDSDNESTLSSVSRNYAFPVVVSPSQEPKSMRKKNFVGTTATAPIRGVLRKKYAWREFPELEGYLIENRDQYLSFSSQLNYTADQKRYNNRLTQGLLDLAAESGYRFEGFTFAMIRDRIRCYYKSYVQAVKKKRRKKRH